MEEVVQKATTILTVDGDQAKNEIADIDSRVKQLDKDLKEARKSNDEALIKSLKKQRTELLKNKKELQRDIVDVNQTLNNLSTAKPKELNQTIRTLTKQLNSPAIQRGSREWKQLNEQINRCRRELASVNSELALGQSRWQRMSNFFNNYIGIIGSFIAAITGISLAFNKLRQERNALEDSAKDVKALTGLDDESISWLTEKAKVLSTTLTKEGIRIQQKAQEILEAFKLVGSAKPELLVDKEALADVTEQTLILAQASGMKLTNSVEAVTLALNQYGDGADQAARYTNALAAGSKYGAAAVESQTKTIKTSGVAAASANIPIEQLVGTIETLGEKGIKDEIAGTGLKKFFLTLQTGANETNPKIVGLEKALDNLRKKQLSAAQIKKQFGEEGYNVASVLINEAEKVKYYTEAVTGTSVAIEQAGIKSETASAKLAQARNKITLMGIDLMEKLNPALIKVTGLTANWMGKLVVLITWIDKNKSTIITLIATLATYTIVVNSAAIADKLHAFWIDKVQVAAGKLYKTLMKHPYALLAAVIVTWLLRMKDANRELSEMEKRQRALNRIESEAAQATAKQRLEVEQFLRVARDETKSKQERLFAVQKLNEISPEYLGNLTLEEINTNKATVAVNKYVESILKLAKAQAAKNRLVEIEEEKIRLDTDPKAFEEQIPWWEEMEVGFLGMISSDQADKALAGMVQRGRERRDKVKADLDNEAKALKKIVEDSVVSLESNTTPIVSGTQRIGDNMRAKEKMKAFQKALKLHEDFYAKLKNQHKQAYLDEQINEAVYTKNIEMIELSSLATRIDIMKKFGQATGEEEGKLLDKRIAFIKKWGKALMAKDYMLAITEEEEADPELEKKLDVWKRSYNVKHAMLEDQYQKGLLTQQEYQEQERELLEEHLNEMLSKRSKYANMAGQIASQASQLVKALEKKEELAIEKKYASQLKAAKGNAEKTAQLEERMEEEKKDVKKKYADIDFAITAAQIIADTAAAEIQLWAKPGWPAALPLMAVVAGIGIAQLMIANQQREQIKNLWTGGFTESGPFDEPKGIVHSEEFVGNRFAVRNPVIRRVFNLVDLAQKNNTVASIGVSEIAHVLNLRTAPESSNAPISLHAEDSNALFIDALHSMNRTVSDLKKQLENGTLARTYVTGDGGTKTARDKYDKMLKNVTRNRKVKL